MLSQVLTKHVRRVSGDKGKHFEARNRQYLLSNLSNYFPVPLLNQRAHSINQCVS